MPLDCADALAVTEWPDIRLLSAPRQQVCDVFLKIGGSILDDASRTAALLPHIVALATRYRMLILVGGGSIAKRIKANQREHATDFYRCWKSGVLCHDVNAGLLASHSTVFEVASSAADVIRCLDSGKIAVLAAAGALLNNLYFTPDWRITTDSMGAYFAATMRARRYVIVSNVDGIHAKWPDSGPPIARIGIADLERLPSSKLDAAFPTFYRRYPVPTFIVNGRYPGRVRDVICGEAAIATEIVS
jgi:aspartokinase-like uncharacterized kinase